jgi:hypothetical protein
MSDGRDESSDMRRSPLDDFTAERLLTGHLRPEDAPLGWEHVALLVEAATGPAEDAELAAGPSIAAAMADLILGDTEIVSLDSRRPGLARFRTARVAGIAAAVVLFTATAAAAAANSLPRPAQTAVSNAAATVGVSLPKPAPASDHDADDAPAAGAPTSAAHPSDHDPVVGAASTNPASAALCQVVAAAHGDPSQLGDKRTALGDEAAASHESVADFCRGLVRGHTSSTTPAAPSTTAELLPPVCTPPKAGLILASASGGEGRTWVSAASGSPLIRMPRGLSPDASKVSLPTAAISPARNPLCWAATARAKLRAA